VRSGTYKNHQTSRSDIKSITSYLPEIGYQVWRTGKTHTNPPSVFRFTDIPGFEVDCVSETANYFMDSLDLRIRNTNDPFCLFVCSTNPHAPWTVGDRSSIDPDKLLLPPHLVDSKEFREIYRTYLAEVKALDEQVGAVWKMLEETGQLDNTLLIFLGEQGPQFPGGKWTMWNAGVHSSILARYPAKIKAGSISDVLVQYEDILPTLIEFIGGKPAEAIEGKSFLPALFGKKEECRQWAYGIHNNVPEGSAYPIRSIRDKQYKLIMNLTPEAEYIEKHVMNSKVWTCWMYGDEHAKNMADRYVHRPAIEFYDTKNDPWEMNNLASDKKYEKKMTEMKQLLEQWMTEQGDRGAAMDVVEIAPKKEKENKEKLAAIKAYDHAVLIKDGWIRDPYICIGRDGYYYLTGTAPNPGDQREAQDKYNLGLTSQALAMGKQPSIVGHKIRIWRSPDLAVWEAFGVQFSLEEGYWAQKHPEAFEKDSGKEWFVWAPEMYYSKGNWIFVHTSPSPYRNGANLIVSNGLAHGELSFPMGDDMLNKHDPSLFLDDDGTWYLTWANTFIAPLKPGFAGFAAPPQRIDPSDRLIGHEGATIKKIGKKYVLFGTGWSTDQGRKGSYNLYYCTADNIFGPYSERRFAGRFLGHGTPFQDKEGRWWCTAFYNANVPPLDSEGIQQRDLSETAQTINEQGTTIVPLDVKILENGDVYVRAKDDKYATIGPDEIDKDKLK
jgi:arylsulfatase